MKADVKILPILYSYTRNTITKSRGKKLYYKDVKNLGQKTRVITFRWTASEQLLSGPLGPLHIPSDKSQRKGLRWNSSNL